MHFEKYKKVFSSKYNTQSYYLVYSLIGTLYYPVIIRKLDLQEACFDYSVTDGSIELLLL